MGEGKGKKTKERKKRDRKRKTKVKENKTSIQGITILMILNREQGTTKKLGVHPSDRGGGDDY
jgi:hypothetical protein